MPSWKEELWKACNKAYYRGGEVKIVFIRRDNKIIPNIYLYPENYIRCDEETIVSEED